MRYHIGNHESPLAQTLYDGALIFRRNVDDDFLKGFKLDSVFFTDDDLGLRDLQFIALAAHILQKDGDVQFAAAGNLVGIRTAKIYLQAHIHFQFPLQAFPYLP